MIQIEIKSGDLEVDSTNEEIYNKILYEFAKTEPMNVEAQLGDESQIMIVIDDKLESIKENIQSLKTLVDHRFAKSQKLVEQLIGLQQSNRKNEFKRSKTINKESMKRKNDRLNKR